MQIENKEKNFYINSFLKLKFEYSPLKSAMQYYLGS